MKDWKLLTDEELAALTDKEVEFYKKLLYAENGIKMVEEPNKPESLKEPCDITVYYISGIGENLIFLDLEEAKAFADTLKSYNNNIGHLEYNSMCGYGNNYFEPGLKERDWSSESPYTIKTKEVFSKQKFLEMQSQMVAYENMKKQYDKDKSEYEKINTKAIEVTKDYFEKLTEARNRVARRKNLTSKFYEDYMPLAENAYHVAMGFMKKAYDISEEDEAYIKNNPPKSDEQTDN